MKANKDINYKQVIDHLNNLITTDYGKKWYSFEISQFYNGEEDIVLIHLVDNSCDNKYRLYHSLLNDNVNTTEDLIKCCIDELWDVWKDIKDVMGSIVNNGLVER